MKYFSRQLVVYMVVFCLMFVIFPIELARAQAYTVHFICSTMNRGNGGSITFAGTTYQHGESASYGWGDYWVTGNPPSPTSDWFFYRWRVMWLGSQSWVDNQYAQSTWFHLRGEAYLEADFYSPIQANSPLYPTLFYGEKQRVTGSARQYYSQQLDVCYYPHGSGYGPSNPNGQPPFGCPGGAGYGWTTVTVSPSYPGTWDTGLITPTIPLFNPSYTLPMTVDVFAGWGLGCVNEVDSNVVSFVIDPAPVLVAAPTLTPSAISFGESVSITDEIFSQYFINAGDMTGTWTMQAKREGESTWTDIAFQSFTSIYDYSTVYGEYGVLHRIFYSWTPPLEGTYFVRVSYSGNRLYNSQVSLSSTLVVSQPQDFGISVDPSYKSIEATRSVEYTVTVTSINGFNSVVSLDASASPTADLTFSFDPPSITPPPNESAQSILTVSTTMATPVDEHIITITATGGEKEHSTQATLLVEPHTGKYTIVFVPLNWQGSLTSFYAEADTQARFLIKNVGVLTEENTEILKLGKNLVLSFDKASNGYKTFNQFAHISEFANDNKIFGDRYVAMTNEDIWGSVAGLATFYGKEVVYDASTPYTEITAHELGHTWGLLDEYNHPTWQQEHDYLVERGLPIPNTYPGYDGGRLFDGKRCIMGYAGMPETRAFCPECYPWLDQQITKEWSPQSGGFIKSVITFYANGTSPSIEEVSGIGTVGKPSMSYMPQNYSLQVYSQSGNLLYNSNVSMSFLLLPSQPVLGNATPTQVYSMTISWILPAFSHQVVNMTLTDNIANQTITSQIVSVPTIVPDISVSNVISSKTDVGQGYHVKINVTVHNLGLYEEHFNVTVYYNETAITLPNGKNYTTITLTSGNSTTVTFTWNTTDVAKGNYTTTAKATPLPGETDITDNTLTDGWITVTIPGDVDGDFRVSYKDLFALAAAYGSKPGDANYNPNCDIDGDNKVGYKDLFTLAAHYGEKYP